LQRARSGDVRHPRPRRVHALGGALRGARRGVLRRRRDRPRGRRELPARVHGDCGNLPAVNLAGRTVLLTGATGGLGNAIARALGGRGARLLLSGRRTDALEPLAEALGARAIAADLSSRDDVERLAAEAGAVDILVANAGLPADGPVLEYSAGQIDRALGGNPR